MAVSTSETGNVQDGLRHLIGLRARKQENYQRQMGSYQKDTETIPYEVCHWPKIAQ